MAFLAPLLSAGMSTGILPNIIKGVGDFVQDSIGGIISGKPVLETLGAAAKKGLATVFGGAQAGSGSGEPAAPTKATVMSPDTNVANSRPVIVPDSAGLRRLAPRRPRYDHGDRYGRRRDDRRDVRRDEHRRRKYRRYYNR